MHSEEYIKLMRLAGIDPDLHSNVQGESPSVYQTQNQKLSRDGIQDTGFDFDKEIEALLGSNHKKKLSDVIASLKNELASLTVGEKLQAISELEVVIEELKNASGTNY